MSKQPVIAENNGVFSVDGVTVDTLPIDEITEHATKCILYRDTIILAHVPVGKMPQHKVMGYLNSVHKSLSNTFTRNNICMFADSSATSIKFTFVEHT